MIFKNFTISILFVTGFCLTISDGDYFPIPNFVGLGILGSFAYVLSKKENERG